MHAAIAATGLLLATLPLPPELPYPPERAEAPERSLPEGSFRARYDLRIMGANVGRATTQLSPVKTLDDGRRVRMLEFGAETSGFVGNVVQLDEKHTGVLGAETLLPLRMRRQASRGDDEREIRLDFDDGVLESKVSRKGQQDRERRAPVQQPAATPVSSILWLLGRDWSEGDEDTVGLYTDDSRDRLVARAAGRETITTDAGTFRARRLDCVVYDWWPEPPLEAGDRPSEPEKKTEITIWLADDPFRTPVRIKTSFGRIGRARVDLQARTLGE